MKIEEAVQIYVEIKDDENSLSVEKAIFTSVVETLLEDNRILRGQLNDAFGRGFIHIDKIKSKIEELNTRIKADMVNFDKCENKDWKQAIHRGMAQKIETKKVLQELLESEENKVRRIK